MSAATATRRCPGARPLRWLSRRWVRALRCATEVRTPHTTHQQGRRADQQHRPVGSREIQGNDRDAAILHDQLERQRGRYPAFLAAGRVVAHVLEPARHVEQVAVDERTAADAAFQALEEVIGLVDIGDQHRQARQAQHFALCGAMHLREHLSGRLGAEDLDQSFAGSMRPTAGIDARGQFRDRGARLALTVFLAALAALDQRLHRDIRRNREIPARAVGRVGDHAFAFEGLQRLDHRTARESEP